MNAPISLTTTCWQGWVPLLSLDTYPTFAGTLSIDLFRMKGRVDLAGFNSIPRYLCIHSYLPTLPYPTLPYPTLPYPTLPCPALPYPTLPCPTLPYPTLPYPTLSTYMDAYIQHPKLVQVVKDLHID